MGEAQIRLVAILVCNKGAFTSVTQSRDLALLASTIHRIPESNYRVLNTNQLKDSVAHVTRSRLPEKRSRLDPSEVLHLYDTCLQQTTKAEPTIGYMNALGTSTSEDQQLDYAPHDRHK